MASAGMEYMGLPTDTLPSATGLFDEMYLHGDVLTNLTYMGSSQAMQAHALPIE